MRRNTILSWLGVKKSLRLHRGKREERARSDMGLYMEAFLIELGREMGAFEIRSLC